MKNILRLFILISFFSINSYAKNLNISSSVSLVGMSMDYREYDDSGQILDSEKSDFTDLTGIEMNIGYFFDKEASVYNQVNINLMLLSGQTKYVGAYSFIENSKYGDAVGTTEDTIMDTDISYKRTNILSRYIDINYGIGLGYRSWKRELSVSQVEIYKWFSLRPMLGAKFAINDNLNIGIALEYQYGIDPKMSESTFDYDFSLGSADIFELSLPVSYKYSDRVSMFIEYTLQQQTIEKSNSINRVINGSLYEIWEPDSTANNQYLKLGLAFKF